MDIKSGLALVVLMWVGVSSLLFLGWGVVQLGIMLAGAVGGMTAVIVFLSVFVFLVGAFK